MRYVEHIRKVFVDQALTYLSLLQNSNGSVMETEAKHSYPSQLMNVNVL